jgi:hypothetical protein
MADFNSYELSRNWFDWCFENPEKIRPNHTALYFFAIEHCNRLGWKEKFGLPKQMSMDAIGIKNWRTYSQTFEDLVSWGFFDIIERSKNQYSATVIAIVKNTKANTKALSKATQKHSQKQSSSIVVIDKQYNKPNNNTETIEHIYKQYPPFCLIKKRSLGKCEKNKEQIKKLLQTKTKEELLKIIDQYKTDCISTGTYMKNFATFLNNLPDYTDSDIKPRYVSVLTKEDKEY